MRDSGRLQSRTLAASLEFRIKQEFITDTKVAAYNLWQTFPCVLFFDVQVQFLVLSLVVHPFVLFDRSFVQFCGAEGVVAKIYKVSIKPNGCVCMRIEALTIIYCFLLNVHF